jgi:hypothetical protein
METKANRIARALLLQLPIVSAPTISHASLHADGSSTDLFFLALLMISPWLIGGVLLLWLLVWIVRKTSGAPEKDQGINKSERTSTLFSSRRNIRITALLITVVASAALILWVLIRFDGSIGRNHTYAWRFYRTAKAWSLESANAKPEIKDGIVVGVRVKAVLNLRRDIDLNIRGAGPAAPMPTGLVVRVLGVTDNEGTQLFMYSSPPVITLSGQTVPNGLFRGERTIEHERDPLPTVSKGRYDIEQVFWFRGLRVIYGISQPCIDEYGTKDLNRLTMFDQRYIDAHANVSFFNGDRFSFKIESHNTETLPLEFKYDHERWATDWNKVLYRTCKSVEEQIAKKAALATAQKQVFIDRRKSLWDLQFAATQGAKPIEFVVVTAAAEHAFPGWPAGVDCGPDDRCRVGGLSCKVLSEQDFNARCQPQSPPKGIVHNLTPRDDAAHLQLAGRPLFLLETPSVIDGVKQCFVLASAERLVDPGSLAGDAQATMRCNTYPAGSVTWPRSDEWLKNRDLRVKDINEKLETMKE